MKHFMLFFSLLAVVLSGQALYADVAPEPFTYTEDFETRELQAWASYPLWQDTAYDPHFHIGTMVPGDPNISMMQKVIPYTNVDNYAGGQKKLDMYMIPGNTITLRYYIKTTHPVEYFKIRLAAGPDGKVDYTISNPPTNRWAWVTVSYSDFVRQNPHISGKNNIKVNALAVLAKIPDADPAMPIFLGLDDIVFKGARATAFQFDEPEVYKLSEWKPYIPNRHYHRGDTFTLRGTWPLEAGKVTLDLVLFTDHNQKVLTRNLKKSGNEWSIKDLNLSFDEGLYLGILTAYQGREKISDTEFTLYIAPENIGGTHPRVWFDSDKQKWVEERLKSNRFKNVREQIQNTAKNTRDGNPLDTIVFENDQFHALHGYGNSVPSITPWFDRIGVWRRGVYYNALAYGLLGDTAAGEYAKNLMLKLSTFPYWLHPWFIERGRHIYYPLGEFGQELSVSYDLLYSFMNESERQRVRGAMMKNIVLGCHKGYVEDDLVTNNTSNWVAHITGGSIMCQAALYGDGADVAAIEPYFTGVIFKAYDLIQKALGRDGAYGEGYGYYSFTMSSWSYTVPAVENVFNIDMSAKIHRSYQELIWAGIVKDKMNFYFGDSGGNLRSLQRWAWLLPKYKDPLLGWFYNFMKDNESLMDVLYETEDVPRDDPFDENPVTVFRDVGTTVFKSGWEKDDFVFVMRTGAFYNHQHIDQGTFWLADHGSTFFEERHGSTYYDDPLYQPWYTQPIAHSTILIDHNHQSQRTGDPLIFAEGFHDHAFIYHFLNGDHAAFSSGDIGRLYWGKVTDMKRNVLYLKPRTLLMLDTVVPAKRDVDVSLLYQTQHLNDITAGDKTSTITKEGNTLYIGHLNPENMDIMSVETPHYLYTLRNEKPLEREGMLTVTARTSGNPLTIANVLTTATGTQPNVTTIKGDGCISGTINSIPFAFSTRLHLPYKVDGYTTDALAITWGNYGIFAALSTRLEKNGGLVFETQEPITCEIKSTGMKYYHINESEVVLGSPSRPGRVTVNGKLVTGFQYDSNRKAVILMLPAGEGEVLFQ